MAGPLAGIRVVDLSQVVSGPMAAMMLAEQGAAVVKVESPGGDPVRMLGPRKGDRSAMFIDRKSTRLNSSHSTLSRMPSSA